MTTTDPQARMAEALVKHSRKNNRSGVFHSAACWGCSWETAGVWSTDEQDKLFAEHQAEVIAALPRIAVVALPEPSQRFDGVALPKPSQRFSGGLSLWEIETGCKVAYLQGQETKNQISIPQRHCNATTAVQIAASILAAARAAEVSR